jgi:hypothetical protein
MELDKKQKSATGNGLRQACGMREKEPPPQHSFECIGILRNGFRQSGLACKRDNFARPALELDAAGAAIHDRGELDGFVSVAGKGRLLTDDGNCLGFKFIADQLPGGLQGVLGSPVDCADRARPV